VKHHELSFFYGLFSTDLLQSIARICSGALALVELVKCWWILVLISIIRKVIWKSSWLSSLNCSAKSMFISLKFTVNKYPTSFINAISFHRTTLNCLLHHIIDTDPETATTVYSIDDNPGRSNN